MNINEVSHLNPIPLLNAGFIALLDSYGTDETIVESARISYGKGTVKSRNTQSLIDYLMRNNHTSPFEMVEFRFLIKMPIFVARQWVRHRTASLNEYSLRYSEAIQDFYLPSVERLNPQSATNKQASEENVVHPKAKELYNLIEKTNQDALKAYNTLIKEGVSREIARTVLPVSNYTEMVWKMDLHNLLHFLELRLTDHAQYEIRVYAQAILDIISRVVPLTVQSFQKYRLDSVSFSRPELSNLLISCVSEPELSSTEEVDFFKKLSKADRLGSSSINSKPGSME